MNRQLKTIEKLTNFIYNELKVVTADPDIGDKSHNLLKEAIIDAVNLQRKIENARAWLVSNTES